MSGGTDIYAASVPVLTHYTARIRAMVMKAGAGDLAFRLAPQMFTTGENFASALGFAIRAVFPVLGRPMPDLPDDPTTQSGLIAKADAVAAHLGAVDRAEMNAAAEGRMVRHIAGEAELDQPAWDYVTRFALPNFFFHLAMGYAGLRVRRRDVGKADFDGLHAYSPGFAF
ncbi:DUF1993 family protein [Rhodobacterales bacterium HKCCE3408]|nr:DUF1993 family protein [Rhodobacterales bacterium HKCCE3408]